MKNLKFVSILITILVVYLFLNYYLIIKLKDYFKLTTNATTYVAALILFLIISYFIGRILEKILTNWLSLLFVALGTIWMGIALYMAMFFAVADFLKFILLFLFPAKNIVDFIYTPLTAVTIITLTSVILILGYLNLRHPKVKKLKIKINKKAGELKNLNIIVVSDIHMGFVLNKQMVGKIANIINKLKPDMVLFPGDVVDEDLPRIIKYDIGKPLENIRAKYGSFAVTGNHEFIGGIEKAKEYLINKKINLIEDSLFFIDDSFFLIGREDLSISFFKREERTPLKELMNFVDVKYPVILLDHQPFGLEEASNNNIDLQISGHTHNGQLWPFNFITKLIYKKSFGYFKKGETHYYISSGVGAWGPPFKTTGRAEIVNLLIEFSE